VSLKTKICVITAFIVALVAVAAYPVLANQAEPETVAVSVYSPTDIRALPGAVVELPITVRCLSVNVAVYAQVYDAEAVNVGDKGWLLTGADAPGTDQFQVQIDGVSVPREGCRLFVLDEGTSRNCVVRIRLPSAVTGYGPRRVKIAVFSV
jgi:hypothetical protein